MVTKVNLRSKFNSNMAELFNARSTLHLFVLRRYTALRHNDVSEKEDGGDASYLIDSPLYGSELFSFSEIVSETPVVELASASLQFKHCQWYFGFSRVGW